MEYYLHYSQKLSQEDYEIIDWALEVTNLKKYKNRTLKSLSGGQQQRVWIAMALAQKTPYLLLDEPTSRIDSLNEAALLESLKQIKDEKLIIIVSHRKSSLALCDEIIEIEQGMIKK